MTKLSTLCLTIGSGLLLGALTAAAAELDASKLPPASTKTGLTFVNDIKPIFDKSCVKCHSGEKPKAKLTLDTLEGVLKGGKDNGKTDVVPGHADQSKLLFAAAHVGDEDDFMPPPKNKANIGPLTPEQVGIIRAWIDQGAK